MTIEGSILLTGISVAGALYFGLSTKKRNEKNDTKAEAEKAVSDTKEETKNDTLVRTLRPCENGLQKSNHHSRVITSDWTVKPSIRLINRRATGQGNVTNGGNKSEQGNKKTIAGENPAREKTQTDSTEKGKSKEQGFRSVHESCGYL